MLKACPFILTKDSRTSLILEVGPWNEHPVLGPRVSGNAVSPPEVPSLVLMFLHCDCVQTRERECLSN